MKQMRAELDRLKKSEKAAQKQSQELEELRRFKAEQETRTRISDAEKAFEAAGLPPKAAALFVKEHEGEITAEAVKGFAENFLGLESKQEEAVPDEPNTFTPTTTGMPPGPREVNRSEVDALVAQGRYKEAGALLQTAVDRGVMKWSDDPRIDRLVKESITNP